ncbi:MAG TPA: hypothetical protein VGA72_01800 [Anaerolineales bacterium]
MKRLYPPILLLIIAILAYGLLIPQMGFYWDDLPISWIRYQLGPEALTQYFSMNRPVWGMLYQLTTRIISQVPVHWQIFAILWRWLGAVVVWGIARQLWKDKPRFALGVALLFLVYPGFNQQWAAFLYSHFFIVLFFFLFSLLCMLWARDQPNRYWLWTSMGMLSSALNLWMMEYFFTLELIRIGVIWTALRAESMTIRDRIKRAFGLWLPYLTVFVLAVLSRLFIFNNQVYGISLTEQLKTAPIETVKRLVESILLSLRLVIKDSWMQVFRLPDPLIDGPAPTAYFLVVIGAIIVGTLGFLLLSSDCSQTYRKTLKDAVYAIDLGILAVFMAGWPFWLIGFEPSLAWPANRFTLPFMFGACLILVGLIALIPWQSLRYLLVVLLVGLAVGKQFLWADDYRDDWNTQKSLFWQLTWRAPGIKPDTLLLLNEGALDYYADNSLSSALNWIYAPDNRSAHIEYVLFYPTTRLRNALPELKKDIPIYSDYLAGEFHGNTSQTLAIYFDPPGCLRILDPEIEGRNRLIRETSLMRFAAHISSPNLIIDEPRARMPEVYAPEPGHGWCYYFEKADLARQFGDWEEVVSIGDAAFRLAERPHHPVEIFVFIEGYAHTGEWQRALELSRESQQLSTAEVGPLLCLLWERIEMETVEGPGRREALSEVKNMFACNP